MEALSSGRRCRPAPAPIARRARNGVCSVTLPSAAGVPGPCLLRSARWTAKQHSPSVVLKRVAQNRRRGEGSRPSPPPPAPRRACARPINGARARRSTHAHLLAAGVQARLGARRARGRGDRQLLVRRRQVAHRHRRGEDANRRCRAGPLARGVRARRRGRGRGLCRPARVGRARRRRVRDHASLAIKNRSQKKGKEEGFLSVCLSLCCVILNLLCAWF